MITPYNINQRDMLCHPKEAALLRRWMKFTNPNKGLVGLDIGPDALKLLEINSALSTKRIENFAISPLPSGSVVKNEIKVPDLIGDVLKSTFKQAGIKTKNVAVAIPRSSTIIKNINVDSRLNPTEIETRAWIEANHHFPDLVGESYLDFSIVGSSGKDTSQLELILVACRKDIIKPYLDIIKASGLTLKIVDVNSFALERALSLISANNPELKTIALLNFDVSLSTLIVTQNQKLIYAHDELFEGQRLMNQMAEANEDETKIQTALKENLSAYLRHAMHFFYSSRPNVAIEKIYLSGDCAINSHLALFIQQEIGVETLVGNPLQNMGLNPSVNEEEINKYAPSLALCAGLALSSVD